MQLAGLTLYLVLCGEIALAATVKGNNEGDSNVLDNAFEGEAFAPDYRWESMKDPRGDANRTSLRAIEEDILSSLSRLDAKEKRRIFDDLKKQKTKPLTLAESDGPSPLNVVELKAVQKSIRTSSGVLPTIRNKRTLNFLLFAVARAMGYVLVPRNPDPRMIPVQSHPCKGIAPGPPPCAPPPPSSPPPTIPPNQIDANTVRYPYRPSQQIPLLQFAPLPPGVTVPYPPLLQPPCGSPQPTPKSSSCTTPTKAPPPPPCAPRPPPPPPPCAKNSHPSCSLPMPPGQPPPPLPPCQRCPPPSTQPPPPCQSHHKCSPPPPPPSTQPPPPSPRCKNQPSCPPPPPPKKPPPPKQKPLILEYDHPVKIQIFNNVRKFLPASGTTYSGVASQSSIPEKLEEYERLDEEAQSEDESDVGYIRAPNEEIGSEDSQDEVREDLYNREPENQEDDEEPVRIYERRTVSEPNRKFKVNTNSIEDVSKQNGNFKSSVWDRSPKKSVLKRVIKIKKPVTKQIDENGNEYTFARSTIHEIRKRDLQDFDFIRKYKENQEEGEDDQYKNENPRGRTTTSIRKIEVKKFVVNKSEDEPIEHHEKTERNFEDPPRRLAQADQEQQREEEEDDEGGDQEERVSYKEYEPPEDYEERREMEKALENELENEEELVPPKSAVYDSPPPTGKGVQYVRKTITKYVGGTGGKETIKYVPIYKVIHAPPPPPPPPQVRKIIHHHHHRIPVYPKIIVRTGSAAKRKPSFLAHFGNAGNLLLVTIRERNG